MPLTDLTPAEKEIVYQCLKASCDGPFFPECEFHTIFGIQRDELREVINEWPDVDDGGGSAFLAINNSLNNLLGYPHNCEHVWNEYIGVSSEEVSNVFNKWKQSDNRSYFNGLR